MQVITQLFTSEKKIAEHISILTTDFRREYVSKKVNVGACQYFKWIEGFTTYQKSMKINIIHVTLSQ
jgi:hypothetical protein